MGYFSKLSYFAFLGAFGNPQQENICLAKTIKFQKIELSKSERRQAKQRSKPKMATPVEKVATMVQAVILTEFPRLKEASIKSSFRQVKARASQAISEKINAEVNPPKMT